MYHLFHSPPLFRTAVSGGALWVQRDSPDFRSHTHLWAQMDLCLCRSSALSKDAPQKMQSLGTIKKSGKSVRRSGGKIPHIRPSSKQNKSESHCSCIIWRLMNRDKYADMGLWVKCALVKSSGVSKNHARAVKTKLFQCSYPLCNKPLYFWKKSASASIVAP